MGQISYGLNVILNFYMGLILLWCVLSWIPTIDREKQPVKTLNLLIEPYLNLFRRIIPPAGGIDFSPMIAMILLVFVGRKIIEFLALMGL